MEKVRIGVIGTGFARSTQIPTFKNCAGAEIVSIASASFQNAEKVAHHFDIVHFTDNWKETVERTDVDLISITTPPLFHHEMALYALECEKHVICEKPMAMNAAQAEEMTMRANEKGLLALIDHELRFLNVRRKAFDLVRAGKIGKITHAKQTFRNGARGVTDVKWNWWSDENAGGGVLGAIGSHGIDSFRWLLGTQVDEVFCSLKANITERADINGDILTVTSDDEANLILRFADGEFTENASGTASFSVFEAGEYEFYTHLFGTDGALLIGESRELKFVSAGSGEWQNIEVDVGEPAPGLPANAWTIGSMAFAEKIVESLLNGKSTVENAATFADGFEVQKILDAARLSNSTKAVVRVT